MISPARAAAYDLLLSVARGNADLPSAIATARKRLDDDRDRSLAAEIATGVQRWRAALDYLITVFARRDVDRLDPEVLEILRLSAYQLLHLTRVPAAAVVDDGVNLAKRAGKKSASGFVNAVLRAISRKRHALPLPPRPSHPEDRDAALEYLSISLSHPRWLATRWYDRFGLDVAERWMQFDNSPAPLTLRVNTLKTERAELVAALHAEGVRVRPALFAPDALIVEEGQPLRGPAFEQGGCLVQDEASQLVAHFADARPGNRVLDACASPGGKTTAMWAAMQRRGFLVAGDVRDRRIHLLRRTLAGAGADRVRVVQLDLLAPLPFGDAFDLVVVDAPCSGLGTLRRDPDIRWRRREEDLQGLAASELRMLQHASEGVAVSGRLVYSTCSSEPEENEDVVSAFLATTPGFVMLERRTVSLSVPQSVLDDRGCLRTEPHRHGLEAFFGAVFERRSAPRAVAA
jgi:16S rRNA (cytosine967-C5)-methyltransferase